MMDKWKLFDTDYGVEDYLEKQGYCEDLLQLLDIMDSGESTIKGLLQFELFKTREALNKLKNNSVSLVCLVCTFEKLYVYKW